MIVHCGQYECPMRVVAVLQGKERLADQMRQELAGESRSDHLMLVNAYEVSH